MESLIIQLIGGAVGGNVAGTLMKNISMGILWNSVLGILGGGIGGQLLGMLGILAGPDGGMDLASIIGNVASSGVGGGALLAIVSLVKNAMGK